MPTGKLAGPASPILAGAGGAGRHGRRQFAEGLRDVVRSRPPGTLGVESAATEKDRFTSLDAVALAREVRSLGRAHVDKIFDAGPESFAVSLRAPGAGRVELLLVLGRYGALLEEGVKHGEEPGPLAREMRRLLSGAILSDVPDPAGERHLELLLTRADSPEPLRLAVEFFGTGNLVVARGERIVAVAHPKAWAHRTIRIGAEYRPPPSRGNPWTRTVAELEAALVSSRTDRASTLAARLGFGGPIAEELLVRSELVGAAPAPTEAKAAAARLHRALSELLAELGERPRGYLYRRDGVPFDVEPFRSLRWAATAEVESMASFSDAAHRFFSSLAPREAPAAPDPADVARGELLRQRAQQEQAVAALAAEAAQRNAEADAIYAHYAEAESLRAEAERSQVVTDRIEVSLGEVRVAIWVRKTVDDSARMLYEEAKRAQAKLAGARAAIEETDRKLKSVAVTLSVAAEEKAAAPSARKPHWFEKYRWFISSEGVLVIGGRDAPSNDLIVRRYLKSKDLYVHADIHGAPSVIVKHPEAGGAAPGPATLAEAGQFSVAFSKAWRAGLASTSAFWVTAEQVSKAAASGEFVARGAWVIHGSKNVLRDLPTELGLGTIEYQGAELWCAAPPSALRARGRVRVRVTPGEERDRPGVEIALAEELGLPRSRVQALLPAGGVKVLRT
ncbi:MAG: NFACT family protein [Thermoplasmata archaeon]|nr:NFACT family protein [Thermoplasmata archaeon]